MKGRQQPIQRRTPLKRSNKPIARKTPIKRSTTPIKRTTPIKKLSDHLAAEMVLYRPERDAFLEGGIHPCELQVDDKCTGKGTELHHGKGRGKYLRVKKYWKRACPYCHRIGKKNVTDNSKAAIAAGHSFSRHNKDQ